MIVVDDHLLFDLLADIASPALRGSAAHGVTTSSSWHYRLLRALKYGTGEGTISRAARTLGDEQHQRVISLLETLPPWIATTEARELVPAMVECSARAKGNYLTLEAVAIAVLRDADLYVSVRSDLLFAAAGALGVSVHVLDR